jgi:hypothetical protein
MFQPLVRPDRRLVFNPCSDGSSSYQRFPRVQSTPRHSLRSLFANSIGQWRSRTYRARQDNCFQWLHDRLNSSFFWYKWQLKQIGTRSPCLDNENHCRDISNNRQDEDLSNRNEWSTNQAFDWGNSLFNAASPRVKIDYLIDADGQNYKHLPSVSDREIWCALCIDIVIINEIRSRLTLQTED